MNSGAIAYSPIFLFVKEQLDQLKLPLRMEFNGLIAETREILQEDSKKISESIQKLLPQIFNIRIQSIRWLVEENSLDFEKIYFEINDIITPLIKHPKYGLLAENCSFAIRTNHRVLKSILSQLGTEELDSQIQDATLAEINYSQFMNALKSSIPYSKELHNLINWFDTSLRIEFVLFSLAIIDEYKLDLKTEVISLLSEIIVNDAQQYYATAKIFGLISKKYSEKESWNFPASFVSEQQNLAELGIDEFLNSID